MRNLADFSYLRKRCGHRRVRVKSLALDDTHGRPVFVADPEHEMPLPALLEAIEQAEATATRCPFYLGKVPLRAELPELQFRRDLSDWISGSSAGRAYEDGDWMLGQHGRPGRGSCGCDSCKSQRS